MEGQQQKVKEHSGHVADEIRRNEEGGEGEGRGVGRERLDLSLCGRETEERKAQWNRPLNENVIRGSRNKAEKPGEERGRRGWGGEGAVVACGQGEITKKKGEREGRTW